MCFFAFVLMPETAIYEYYLMKFWKYEVWRSWEVFSVKSIPVSRLENKRADKQFRSGVLTAYPSHIFASVHFSGCIFDIFAACMPFSPCTRSNSNMNSLLGRRLMSTPAAKADSWAKAVP